MKTRSLLRIPFAAAIVLSVVSCTAIVDTDIAPGGIGALCTQSSECQAGTCGADGVCTASCSASADCPASTECFSGSCMKPLKVGALWVGVSAGGEGWTLTHEQGMEYAASKLPYLSRVTKENVVSDQDIEATIDDFVKQGANVIVANSFSQRDATLRKADQYPDVKFLVAQSYKSNGRNADTYAAHGEQGWWIAGKVAGTKTLGSTRGHRIGYVGSFITPEVVRHITAFYRGAKSVDPAVTLEVQWMGFWADISPGAQFPYVVKAGKEGKGEVAGEQKTYFYEQLLTRRLLDHGAVVVGHGGDNQRAVKLIEDLGIPGTYSVSNDNPNAYKALAPQPDGTLLPTGAPLASCLGSPYWNWGPLYTQIFSEIHRGVWDPRASRNEPMKSDVESSVVGFNLNPAAGVDDSIVRGFLNDIVQRGWQSIYNGPYNTTGQRDKDGDGKPDADQFVSATDTLSDSEYERMCWFPEGIIERFPADSDDPANDRPALVPDAAWEADPARDAQREEMTKAAFPGISHDCSKNR